MTRRGPLSRLGFWQQLALLFTTGILILTLATSIVLTLTANDSVKSMLNDRSLYLTDSLARQAKLSLLYQSPEEAQKLVEVALQYPDVVGIRIVTDSARVLTERGLIPEGIGSKPTPAEKHLALEDDNYLVYSAPVRTEIEADFTLQEDAASGTAPEETLGHIILVISKSSLNEVSTGLLKSNVLVSVIVALLLTIILITLSRRLTQSIHSLSQVMLRAEKGELNLRAKVKGPRDIVEMQTAFNTMIAALEKQTGQLKVARDDALASARVKSEFAANVSHELRTPLASVLGVLDLLSVMRMTGKQKEYVQTAKLSAQNLLALIDDILSYVRSDTGKLILEKVPCDLETLMEEVIGLISADALKKKLNIGYTLALPHRSVMIDSQRLRQILINLVGNAVKFTEEGEIAITSTISDSGELIIQVQDTGIGIKQSSLETIFDAFTQEDSSTTRKFGGTGLGLAICRQFTRLMGGKIEVSSTKGEGSTFTLTLPLEYFLDEDDVKTDQTLLADKIIAIVDQSDIVRSFMSGWCERQGARVEAFKTAEDFLLHLNKHATQNTPIRYLFIEERLLHSKINSIRELERTHVNCSQLEVVTLVNPWSQPNPSEAANYSMMEKPITASRLHDYFASHTVPENSLPSQGRKAEKSNEYTEYLHSKILVVDDNKANCLVAGGMLNQIGCDFEVAHNGSEAIDLVTMRSFDAILMDCNMPLMDGYTATKLIREMDSDVCNIPIVAMTANNSVEERDLCLSAGMNDFIAKPLSVEKLDEKIKKLGRTITDPFLAKSLQKITADLREEILDVQKIGKLQESVGEVFDSIVDAYTEDTPIYLQSLKEAIEQQNGQRIFELSHTIKGSSDNFGAAKVVDIAKQMEDKAKAGNLSGIVELYEKLSIAAKPVLELINHHKKKPSGISDETRVKNESPTVLVADDDRSMRLAFINNLRSEGFHVVEASNGQSAIAICSRKMPDLIILDAMMPETNGFEACKKIREMASGAEVPILMVTALEDEHSIAKAFTAGTTDYISKPVNFAVFRQRASRLISSHRAQHYIKKLAYKDSLTGLPNRTSFNQQLRHKIKRAEIIDSKISLLFLDLDRFKLINDSLGHDIGDLVLKSAAERIKTCLRSSDTLFRFGGDEFTVILEESEDSSNAEDVGSRIIEALTRPFIFLKRRLFVTASIGISTYPEHGLSASELIKNADNAMYRAKRTGIGICRFESEMEGEAVYRFEIENDIRSGLEQDQFFMVYQQQVELKTGNIRCVEALLRWRHPRDGIRTPDKFISVAEETGLIGEIGSAVVEKVGQQIKIWQQEYPDCRVSINISGIELNEPGFSNRLIQKLERLDIPTDLLELEMTESVLMENPERVNQELINLRNKGISIAIDDFGLGFSALVYLKNFSVDILKIDKEFVRECDTNKNDQAIIAGIIALAKTLDLKVVAEGVEREEQLEFLKAAGCEYAQGFYLGRPVSADKISFYNEIVSP